MRILVEFSIIVLGVLALAAFVDGKVGYRMGEKAATTKISDYFCYEIKSTDNELNSIPALLVRRTMHNDGSIRKIAEKLHFAAFNEGMAAQSRMNEPKPDESAVMMNRNQLEDIAWLADTGLQVWISPGDQPFRCGERLDYEKAEALANTVETFERRIVPNLLGEAEDEQERRFTTA
jgi:hypothetical protein